MYNSLANMMYGGIAEEKNINGLKSEGKYVASRLWHLLSIHLPRDQARRHVHGNPQPIPQLLHP